MQRCIQIGVIALVFLSLGAGFTVWYFKQNSPYPMWIPLQIKDQLPREEQDMLIEKLKNEICTEQILIQVSKDLNLREKFSLLTDEAVAAELAMRIFVKVGEFQRGREKLPCVHIGLDGVKKDAELTQEILQRIMKDVFKIVGMDSPTVPPAK